MTFLEIAQATTRKKKKSGDLAVGDGACHIPPAARGAFRPLELGLAG